MTKDAQSSDLGRGGRPAPNGLKRKRPRALQACDVCRVRKNRCSEHRPCTYCLEHDLECTYARSSPGRGESQRSRLHPNQRSGHNNLLAESGRVISSREASTASYSNIQDSARQLSGTEVSRISRADGSRDGILQQTSQHRTLDSTNQARISASETPNTASDVVDTNLYTNNLEFYGSASSVAFLRHVETLSNSHISEPGKMLSELSLSSRLHNTDFRPSTSPSSAEVHQDATTGSDRHHFRVARKFLDAYFSNIHYVQPLLEEETFLTRCEDLWFNRLSIQSRSFVALYYATLSLGSLVMTADEPKFMGADRFEWSRKLFNDSLAIVTQLGTATDLEMVQCFYMLSKVCQHELNPHVAYIYSGQAARTALAIGLNRCQVSAETTYSEASLSASQTWWAVYCLDIQTSFALGRPDSLGPDEYHTQHYPPTLVHNDDPVNLHEIVPCMISLSRIMRRTALDLYTSPTSLTQKFQKAKILDEQLQLWRTQLPSHLWPENESDLGLSLKPRRSVNFAKKQSVVLRLRYYNLRMVIHAVFMIDPGEARSDEAIALLETRCRCLQAAEDAIDLIYTTFRTDSFFQSWWFNCTYTLHAVSILLAMVFRRLARTASGLEQLFTHIDRAIAVLQAMDDCMVARNAAAIIKKTLVRAKKLEQPALTRQKSTAERQVASDVSDPLPIFEGISDSTFTEPAPPFAANSNDLSIDDPDLDWLNTYPLDTSNQALFWTEWANELDILGT